MDIRVVLFVVCLANTSDLQTFQTISPIRDIAVSGDYVYIAENHQLHLLYTNLSYISSIAMGSSSVSKIALNNDATFIFVCFLDGICKTYELAYEKLSLLETHLAHFRVSFSATVPTIKKIALGSSSNSTFYVGSAGYSSNTGRISVILRQFQYDWTAACRLRTFEALVTNSSFLSREFHTALTIDNYIYYTAVDTIQDEISLVIIRVCDNVNSEYISEVKLDCGYNTPLFDITYSSLFLNPNQSLVITTGSSNGSRVCIFPLADIDSELQSVYLEFGSTGIKLPLPWTNYKYTEIYSSLELESSECEFGSSSTISYIPAVAVRNSISGDVLYETSDKITATLLLYLDNIHFLYMAHKNVSSHFLAQYCVMNNMTTTLMKIEVTDSTIYSLKYYDELIYAATEDKIFIIKPFDCSRYRDCNSCTSSYVPLCGWCSLEGVCSRRTNCQKAHLRNRWIQNSSSCISYIILDQSHSAVTPLHANVAVIPASAAYPQIDPDEEYYCIFKAIATNYSFTLPFISSRFCDDSNVSLPDFGSEKIQLQFAIMPQNSSKYKIYVGNNTLIVYNCTFISRCRECVAIGVCGWCIFDNMCKGSHTLCYSSTGWRNSSLPNHRCPLLLTPKRGWYLQPASTSNMLKLHTKHLPSLIPGYKYMCEFKYSGGLTIFTSAVNSTSNDSQLQCQIEHNQITIPEQSSAGVEAIQLSLLLSNEKKSLAYVVEFDEKNRDGNIYLDDKSSETPPTSEPVFNETNYNMLVFNCSYFDHDCSSCIAARSGTDFPCVWCRGEDPNSGKCVQILECFETVIISGAHECPNPKIINVSPTSGHIDGGTVLKITGSDLGVSVHDISVLVGTSICNLLLFRYKPGKEIVCVTSRASTVGEVSITIHIRRAETELISIYDGFYYALPNITSVFPRYGPVNGGTLVTISGSDLNVGNTERIFISIVGQHCEIINITNSNLICKTTKAYSHGMGTILIEYGSARVEGEEYWYVSNPSFRSIFPHNTIPAGGVSINFTGNNLNSTQNPRMVIYIGNTSYANTCRTNENTALHCSAPKLPSLIYITEISESQLEQQQSRERGSDIILNYTIIMDDALGPSIQNNDLQLTVKPNPVITDIKEENKVYYIGSEDYIKILGRHLDTVHISEFKIYLGEYKCKLFSVMSTVLKCKPEISIVLSTEMKEIKVFIAKNTLEYNIGYIQLVQGDTSDHSNSLSLIITIVAVMIILAITFCVTMMCVYVCIKRKYSKKVQIKQVPLQMRYFSNLHHEGSDNVYDHVTEDASKNAILTERQLNHYKKNDHHRNPLCHLNVKNTTWVNPPPIQQDDYVEMQSHCIQLQSRDKPRNNDVEQSSTIENTGEYVDMHPASVLAVNRNSEQVKYN